MESAGITQVDMVHRLPKARVVDRIDYLTEVARNSSTVHVGFVDSGCWDYHENVGSWLHTHLKTSARSLIGLDLDEEGVEKARSHGFEAYAVDCSDPAAIAELGLEPAEVLIAGEIIEHLDDSGSFLDGLHALTDTGGSLVVTTPNASGLLNAGAAALAGYEVNHPDHLTLYSCFTLTNLLARHDWEVTEVATYIPVLKEKGALKGRMKLLGLGASAVLGLERLLGRLGRPYAADGLIVSARSTRDRTRPGSANRQFRAEPEGQRP